MSESFGEEWEKEYRYLTGEDPPGKHFYRNIYEEELDKPAGMVYDIHFIGDVAYVKSMCRLTTLKRIQILIRSAFTYGTSHIG